MRICTQWAVTRPNLRRKIDITSLRRVSLCARHWGCDRPAWDLSEARLELHSVNAVCPQCGAIGRAGGLWCPNCHAPMPTAQIPPTAPTLVEPQPSKPIAETDVSAPKDPALAYRGRLSPKANAAMDAALFPGEEIELIIPGVSDSALIATCGRGFIWKRGRLSVYPFENLSTVAFGEGFTKWVQFRGPVIGRSEPTIGNVDAMLDAIRVRGHVDSAARAELERLVANGARSISGFAPGTVTPGIAMTRDSNMPGGEVPLMEAEGRGGHLWLFADRVRIKHHGVRGALTTGVLKGDKEIRLDQITAVQWRDPGSMWLGHIQFSFMGGSSDARIASRDENAILFSKGQEPAFRAIKEEIDRLTRARQQPTVMLVSAPAQPAGPGIPEQIKQLAGLRDAGILTDQEFAAKKIELLSRM